jgi:hypothetical protein
MPPYARRVTIKKISLEPALDAQDFLGGPRGNGRAVRRAVSEGGAPRRASPEQPRLPGAETGSPFDERYRP